jgi:hypothetical protein
LLRGILASEQVQLVSIATYAVKIKRAYTGRRCSCLQVGARLYSSNGNAQLAQGRVVCRAKTVICLGQASGGKKNCCYENLFHW